MRILDEERTTGALRIQIENEDDLWYLKNIIKPGDLIRATVLRRVEKQVDMIRSKETSRKPVFLTIRIETLDFRAFSSSLKLLGTVVSNSEGIAGDHQSVSVSSGDIIEIIKQEWNEGEKDILNESLENKFSTKAIFVAIDDETASVFDLRSYGIQNIGNVESGKSGKSYESSYSEDDYFKRITEEILLPVKDLNFLIILGPGFTRDHFMKYILDRGLFKSVQVISLPSHRNDEGAVYEFLESQESLKILKSARIRKEKELMDKFLKNLNTNNLAAYGMEDTMRSIVNGEAEIIMITEQVFRSDRGQDCLEKSKNSGSQIHIFSDIDEPGIMLQKFGGIAAILRFRSDP
ncbi:MAG: mRNA surveillance protein pelota [Thermoplasmataceae archaeon]|jgi:protein pelota